MKEKIREQTGHVLDLFTILLVFSLLAFILKMIWYITSSPDPAVTPGLNAIARSILSLLILVTRLFLIFYFLRWAYITYKYLKSREELYYLSYSPAMAVWSWFVPVLNLFMPFQLIREIYEGLSELVRGRKAGLKRGLVMAWWLLFLLTLFAGFLDTSSSFANLLKTGTMADPWPKYLSIAAIKLAWLILSVIMFRKFRKLSQLLSAM